jgi:hypothetical protein
VLLRKDDSSLLISGCGISWRCISGVFAVHMMGRSMWSCASGGDFMICLDRESSIREI